MTLRALIAAAFAAFLAACSPSKAQPARSANAVETAVFAGGCFWCTEADFEKLPGVVDAVSGYTGGRLANPTYEDVTGGGTGHFEAVLVRFRPSEVTYAQLVEKYWRTIDPTDAGGQFCDRGDSYKTAIFVTPAQRPVAEASKARLAADPAGPKPIATQILPLARFYPAEEYHQDYAKKNPVRYGLYRNGCGRDRRLAEVWGRSR